MVEDLKLIAYFFNGIPLVIGKDTRNDPLRDNVVYERRGIPAMNLQTFKNLLKQDQLHVISRKGGFYVKVDKKKIHRLRTEQGLSLQDVATKLGVSRKAVYLFERTTQIKEKNALQLEQLFNQTIKLPLDVFNWEIEKEEFQTSEDTTDFQAEIKEIFEDLGYNTYWAKNAPFDAITSEPDAKNSNAEESTLITGLTLSRRMNIYNRINLISEISKMARKLSMFIIEDGKLPATDNVLILQKAILEKMKDIKELYAKLKKVKRNFY
jgi:putative transcriptional regulator